MEDMTKNAPSDDQVAHTNIEIHKIFSLTYHISIHGSEQNITRRVMKLLYFFSFLNSCWSSFHGPSANIHPCIVKDKFIIQIHCVSALLHLEPELDASEKVHHVQDDVTETLETDVVVLGAGMAGVAAARKLREFPDFNERLLVLEGGDRIGGRVKAMILL